MFARIVRSVVTKRATTTCAPRAIPAMRAFSAAPASGDVVVPELVDTLEWVLESPPNVHQFDEPPLVVEVEHLKALKFTDPN